MCVCVYSVLCDVCCLYFVTILWAVKFANCTIMGSCSWAWLVSWELYHFVDGEIWGIAIFTIVGLASRDSALQDFRIFQNLGYCNLYHYGVWPWVEDRTVVHFGDGRYNTTIWGFKFVPFWGLGVGNGDADGYYNFIILGLGCRRLQ